VIVSGFDGKVWRTGIAGDPHPKLEPDPNTWESTYIAANGTSMEALEGFAHLYVAGPRDRPRIGLAHAADVRSQWSKLPKPVLDAGPYRSWDEYGVADPYVIRAGEWFHLFYLGEDRGWRQRIGVARSRDGRTWQKLRTNPILDLGDPGTFDENGLGEPAVWQAVGAYWMIYTGRGAGEIRKLGLARSPDGVHWEKLPQVFSGAQPWNSKVLCDPAVAPQPDGTVELWFGAGSQPSPDEHLNGSIGHALLKPVH